VIVGLLAHAATRRIEAFRRAHRKTVGKVTGFIGEAFGAVQAIKVATAEEGMDARFGELYDARRKVALRDHLFTTVLYSIYGNADKLGTAMILLLVGLAMGNEPGSAPALRSEIFRFLSFTCKSSANGALMSGRCWRGTSSSGCLSSGWCV